MGGGGGGTDVGGKGGIIGFELFMFKRGKLFGIGGGIDV